MENNTKQSASGVFAFIGRYFWLLIILGVLIRLILSGISALNNDVKVWYDLARQTYDHVPIYAYKNFSYPPGAALVFLPAIKILSFFTSPISWGYFDTALEALSIKTGIYHTLITSPLFNFAIKLPLFVTEGIFLYTIYSFLRNKIPYDKLKAGLVLFYLNPLVIFVSAVHAQLEIVPVFLSMLSFFLLVDKKYFFSGMAIAVAIATKLYPVFLVPLLIIYVIFGKNINNKFGAFAQFLIGLIIPIVAVAVYAYFNPEMMVCVFSRFKTIGLEGSLNILTLIYIPPIGRLAQDYSGITIQVANILLALCPLIVYTVFYFVVKKQSSDRKFIVQLLSASVLVLSVVYLFSARTNPTYTLWALPSLIILFLFNAGSLLSYWLLTASSLIFYFAVYYFSWKSYLLPAAGYLRWFKVSNVADDAMHKLQYPGIINIRATLDVFLFCGLAFIVAIIIACIQATRNLRK